MATRLEYKMDYQIRKENVQRCDICCTYFSKSVFSMYNHMANRSCLRLPFNCEESTLERYHCGICQIDFDTIICLKKHVEHEHATERNESTSLGNYICQNCSFQTISLQQWFKHDIYGCSTINCDKNKKSVQCAKTLNRCNNEYIDGAADKWFKCDECTFKTPYKGNLKPHIHHKHTNKAEKYKCEKCTFTTTRKEHLKIHIDVKHTADHVKKWFHCEECTFKAPDKYHLNKHINGKHAVLLKCEKCTYTTTRKDNLKAHIYAKHTEDQDKNWFQCDQCTFKTPHKYYLDRHVYRKHTDNAQKESFNCEKCTFTTTQKYYLKTHIHAKHTDGQGKRWFRCDQCAYKTPYKNALKGHVNNKHTD